MADGPVRWRGGRGEEVALPRPSRGLAVSDRLAGAFRPDRGDGLREASDCLRFRLCMEVVEDGMIEDGMTRFIVESGPWAIWAASTDDKSAPASKKASPRCERARRLRALERSRRRSRLVGWQSRRLLHRSARAGRDTRDAALLPRALAPGLAAGRPARFRIRITLAAPTLLVADSCRCGWRHLHLVQGYPTDSPDDVLWTVGLLQRLTFGIGRGANVKVRRQGKTWPEKFWRGPTMR
jgi:hypothetical protein